MALGRATVLLISLFIFTKFITYSWQQNTHDLRSSLHLKRDTIVENKVRKKTSPFWRNNVIFFFDSATIYTNMKTNAATLLNIVKMPHLVLSIIFNCIIALPQLANQWSSSSWQVLTKLPQVILSTHKLIDLLLLLLYTQCVWLLLLFGFVGIAASDFFCKSNNTILVGCYSYFFFTKPRSQSSNNCLRSSLIRKSCKEHVG